MNQHARQLRSEPSRREVAASAGPADRKVSGEHDVERLVDVATFEDGVGAAQAAEDPLGRTVSDDRLERARGDFDRGVLHCVVELHRHRRIRPLVLQQRVGDGRDLGDLSHPQPQVVIVGREAVIAISPDSIEHGTPVHGGGMGETVGEQKPEPGRRVIRWRHVTAKHLALLVDGDEAGGDESDLRTLLEQLDTHRASRSS